MLPGGGEGELKKIHKHNDNAWVGDGEEDRCMLLLLFKMEPVVVKVKVNTSELSVLQVY